MPDATQQDAFNERELEVLRLIAEGWSNREIADELIVSVNTVRWYNKQIYSKLGVHSRTLAIARARDMGLLEIDSVVSTAGASVSEPEPAALPVIRHNLPTQLTAFVGRQRELDELTRLLSDPDTRLVTLIGPGGIGKTRVAIEASRTQIEQFEQGVYLVELAPVDAGDSVAFFSATVSDFVVSAVAEALGFSFYAGSRPIRQLLDFLRDKHLLLVMDNFEHLLAGADVVNAMLQAAPGLKVLVTSRETLGIYGEVVYALGGLPLPDKRADSDSLRLFVQSARRARPDFALDESNQAQAAHICRLVDGFPLAIELAAAWVRSLSLQEIVDELAQGLDILETRAHSLRATFDRSWDLLTEREQQVFAILSIFQGGCTREAAEAIAGADARMLTTLVDKSLLWYGAEGRYTLHELLRQYGSEKLHRVADVDGLRNRHCEYYAAYAGRWGRALRQGQQAGGLKAIEAEIENIRAAWRWAVQHGKAEAMSDLTETWFFFDIRCRWYEGNELFGTALENWAGDPENVAYGRLLAGQSEFAWRLGLWDRAVAVIERGLALFDRLDIEAETLLLRLNKGNIACMRGDFDTGEQLYRVNLEIAERHNDRWMQAILIGNLSIVAENRGDFDLAEQRLRQQLEIMTAINDHAGLALGNLNLGEIYQRRKQYREATQYCHTSLNLARGIDHQYIMASSMNRLGTIATAQHRPAEAQRLIEDALALNRKNGNRYYVIVNLLSLGEVHRQMGERTAARRRFRDALVLAREMQAESLLTQAVFGVAKSLLDDGELSRAIEIFTFLEHHPTTRIEDREEARQLCEDLQSELPEEVFAAAIEQGKAIRWDTLVTDLLAELAA